jgi:hypothetical protein
MSSITELNALLFENTDKIPEGLYLQLMNLSGKVYNELKVKAIPEIKIKHYDTPMYTLDNIATYKSAKTIRLGNSDNINITGNIIYVGGIFQTYVEGLDLCFYKVDKVNDCSVWFTKWFARFDILYNEYVWYSKEINMKKRNLLTKNIIVYHKPQIETIKLFNECIDQTSIDHPHHLHNRIPYRIIPTRRITN